MKTYKLTCPRGRKIFMSSYTPEVCIERVYSFAVIRLDWYRDWHLKLVPFPALVLSLLTTQSALQHKPHSHSQTVEPLSITLTLTGGAGDQKPSDSDMTVNLIVWDPSFSQHGSQQIDISTIKNVNRCADVHTYKIMNICSLYIQSHTVYTPFSYPSLMPPQFRYKLLWKVSVCTVRLFVGALIVPFR